MKALLDALTPRRLAWALFFGFFALYLHGMPGALAPYRDAGEMVNAAYTLSVAHPPGYPAYVLLGRLGTWIPLGSAAYRLNLLSALGGAAALAGLFLFLAPKTGRAAALAAAALLGAGANFAHVAQVSEMYSIHALNAVVMLALAWRYHTSADTRYLYLQGLYFGCSLGVRMDLLLMGPALAFLAWKPLNRYPSRVAWRVGLTGLGFFFLGLLVFLYLPIRASADPVINWNDPSNLRNFLSSVIRAKYGSTLDLLSKNYAPGELFGVNLKLYLEHLNGFLTPLGVLAGALGFVRAWRLSKPWGSGLFLAFLFPGPVFLYLANMPPNPHALAIVEAHYVLPDVVFAAAAAYGFLWGLELLPQGRLPAALALVLLGAFKSALALPETSRRKELFAHDYALNTLRLVPYGGAVVAREDVQLFSLWHHQWVLGKRPDVKIVPQGLAGSDWFREQQKTRWPGFALIRLNSGVDAAWDAFLRANPGPILASPDTTLPGGLKPHPVGLLASLRPPPGPLTPGRLEAPWALVAQRGNFDYEEQKDFFSSDLIELYSQSRHAQGSMLFHGGQPELAWRPIALAHAYKRAAPEMPLYLGSIASARGDWAAAERWFGRSARLFDAMLKDARFYRSLPAVVDGIKPTAATAYLNWGVAAEKRGDKSDAEARYARAIALNPHSGEAWFNRAVLYWGQDQAKVVEFLQGALRADPTHERARTYLNKFQR